MIAARLLHPGLPHGEAWRAMALSYLERRADKLEKLPEGSAMLVAGVELLHELYGFAEDLKGSAGRCAACWKSVPAWSRSRLSLCCITGK